MNDPTTGFSGQGFPPPPSQRPGDARAAQESPQELNASSFFGGLFDFGFTRFITLSFLKFIYVLVVVVMGLALLVVIVAGFASGPLPGVLALILGPVVALLYLIWIRMGMEFLAVVFRMAGDIHAMRVRQQTL